MDIDLPDLIHADRNHLWHPSSQQRFWYAADPLVISSAAGCWITDAHGHRLIDATAGLGTAVLGHAHPAVISAVSDQLRRLSSAPLQSITHAPAVRLAERLASLTPWGLDRCFFTTGRSSSVEVALKLAWQRQLASGRPEKRRFASLGGCLHGHSLGGLSLSADHPDHELFEPLLFEPVVCPAPRSIDDAPAHNLTRAMQELERHAHELAALFVEPLVVGPAWQMHRSSWLRPLLLRAKELDVLVVLDESQTALHRTGPFLAVDDLGVAPDLLLLSESIAGGLAPLGAVMAQQGLHNTLHGRSPDHMPLGHVQPTAGAPLACAAALALLDVIETGEPAGWAQALTHQLAALLPPIAELPGVREVRQTGVLVAIELKHSGVVSGGPAGAIVNAAREAGAHVHAEGDVLLLQPPLCTPDEVVVQLLEIVGQAIRTVLTP